MSTIANLRMLLKKASIGPWSLHKGKEIVDSDGISLLSCCEYGYDMIQKEDRELIVAMRNSIESLLVVAEAAKNLHEECHRISVETDAPNTQAMACLWRVIEELEQP